ncbi:dual specificity protein phosphatase 14 [Lingula anatina]|uniref:protein-serine/threonine phosphatase n=1 Tax=Lingula anatina TaxID=7574 RepID=A0A1S3IP06_LINAN|nr:dual specificity protein phosphatase 14 [Lingula anatina]|eukprot:XP_013399808.1 dual specificity protein phosphatase 14 [Lingula anatina]
MSIFMQIAQVTDHLFLCSASALSEKRIKERGITCIINITMEVPNLRIKGVEALQINVDDVPHTNLAVYFDRCADKIKSVQSKGGKTLVHCIAGVSRSATICIAYMMKHYKMSLRDAFSHVKAKRPFIRPNVGFWKQLIEYEKKLKGKNSVKMVSSPIGWIPDVYSDEAKSMVWETTYNSTFGKKKR